MSKAKILAALYNHANVLGMGRLHYDPTPMTEEVAASVLQQRGDNHYFDYHRGRVMKISITDRPEDLEVYLYERDNGLGSVENALTCPGCQKCGG